MVLNVMVILGVAVVVTVILSVVGTLAYTQLKTKQQGYPYEEDLERALLPWAYEAIMGAYKASEYALDEFGKRLEGADKTALARMAYGLLSERVTFRGAVVPVKSILSEQQFTRLVTDSFDRFLLFYNANCEKYEAAVDEWGKVNAP